MATSTITLKTDTTANWESSNRILALNEPALERTTDGYINMKLGDGVTPWNKLGYVFKLKTLEELNASASTSSSSASEQVTLAKAELAKCVSEYEKTKEISARGSPNSPAVVQHPPEAAVLQPVVLEREQRLRLRSRLCRQRGSFGGQFHAWQQADWCCWVLAGEWIKKRTNA